MKRRTGVILATMSVILIAGVLVVVLWPSTGRPQHPRLRYWGGPVVRSSEIHAIYWEPSTLQDGSAASMTPTYQPTIDRFLSDFGGSSYLGLVTQYYEATSGQRRHISTTSTFRGSIVDRTALPAASSACRGEVNCLGTDQIKAALIADAAQEGWAPGLSDLVVIYLPPGEAACDGGTGPGRCSDAPNNGWCSSHYTSGSGPSETDYAVVTYTDDGCTLQAPNGDLAPTPNHSVVADAAVSSTAHELMEMITDPGTDSSGAGSGWTSSKGDEIADLCDNASLGPFPFDGGRANLEIHGHPYVVQRLWSDQANGCELR